MSKAKILIVEDDGIFAKELKSNLQILNYEVSGVVSSGDKALSLLNSQDIDLILMDIQIRGALSGIDVAQKIRSTHNIPVVFLSSFTDPDTVELAKKSEPYGFLSKPVEANDLQRTIELALYKHNMESKLKESEERFKQISSSAHDGIILINADGLITFWNEAAEKIFGYSAEAALNKNLFLLIAPEIYLEEYKYIFEVYLSDKSKNGKGKTVELVGKKKDGSLISIELSLSRFKKDGDYNAITIIRDISERKRAEQEEIRLSTALKQTGELVLITNVHGIIEYVNPAFEKTTGYSAQEVIGEKTSIFKSGKQSQTFYKKLWDTISHGDVWKGRLVNRKKDNSLYTEEATISPVRNNLGKIVNYVAVKRDITSNLIIEKKMRQMQNLRMMGLYAKLVVHDINNSLQLVIPESENILELVPDDSEIFPKLLTINHFAKKAAETAQQILTFTAKEVSFQSPLLIQKIIADFFKVIDTIKPPDVMIKSAIDPKCAPVLGNPTQIYQLLLNLCTNAFHAMRGKTGVLTLSLKQITIDSTIARKYINLREGAYARLSVSDTGHGIDRKIVDKIFEPSFSTKGTGEGFGLGLASVRNIIENHTGEIIVNSEPGTGATFHVFIPTCQRKVNKPVRKPEKIVEGTEKVLLVDDEESIKEMLTLSLERLGYKVTSFTSAMQALKKFQNSPNEFDIVITDQTMPALPGDLFAIELLKIRPDIPIILCTGFSERINEEQAKKLGIKEYLQKPFTRRDLSQAIRNIFDKKK
jgi:PAS domain S-box-containing protein